MFARGLTLKLDGDIIFTVKCMFTTVQCALTIRNSPSHNKKKKCLALSAEIYVNSFGTGTRKILSIVQSSRFQSKIYNSRQYNKNGDLIFLTDKSDRLTYF